MVERNLFGTATNADAVVGIVNHDVLEPAVDDTIHAQRLELWHRDINIGSRGGHTQMFDANLRDASGEGVLDDGAAGRIQKAVVKRISQGSVQSDLVAADGGDGATRFNQRPDRE